MKPWRIKRSMGVAAAGGAFLVGILVVPTSANDADHSSDLTDSVGYVVRYEGDWVIYDRGATQPDGRVELVEGEKGPGGTCQMSQSGSDRIAPT